MGWGDKAMGGWGEPSERLLRSPFDKLRTAEAGPVDTSLDMDVSENPFLDTKQNS
ncbi:MAG: hypothetical protein ACYC27_09305 [Armatimonadota bacterium]